MVVSIQTLQITRLFKVLILIYRFMLHWLH